MKFLRSIFFIVSVIFFVYEINAFRLGLENIPDSFIQRIKDMQIGLVTNQTGKDQNGKRNIEILRNRGLKISAILVPEHGLDGNIPAEHDVRDSYDTTTGIPIISLYEKWSGKVLNEDLLRNIDVLIFDIQDCGMRHFTYISTLFLVLESAAQFKRQIVVLDRPNLLGSVMEGPLVESSLQSFVSIASIPLRYGMTVGELAWYFNKNILEKPAHLHVIQMHDYTRNSKTKDFFLTQLSPNLQSCESCYGYSFLGVLSEIRPFDIAIQTDIAYQALLLPEDFSFPVKQWKKLRLVLRKHGIESSLFNYFSKRKRKNCYGLRLHVDDVNSIASFDAALDIIDFFNHTNVSLTFSPLFDKIVGTKKVKDFLTGSLTRKEFVEGINTALLQFFERAKGSFMYQPFPKVRLLS